MFYDGITDFIFAEDMPEKSDIIFIPGSICPELAHHAATLYHDGYAPCIMPSGKYSIVKGHLDFFPETGDWENAFSFAGHNETPPERGTAAKKLSSNADRKDFATECDYLCAVLRSEGVPEEAILREREATFTWENAIFSRRVADASHLTIRQAILCCKAYHARRSLMYYQQQFPDTRFLVCPAAVDGISRDSWHRTRTGIDTVLGEVERCGTQFHEILAELL